MIAFFVSDETNQLQVCWLKALQHRIILFSSIFFDINLFIGFKMTVSENNLEMVPNSK